MVAEIIYDNKIDIVCIKETKLSDPDSQALGSIASRKFYVFCILNTRVLQVGS